MKKDHSKNVSATPPPPPTPIEIMRQAYKDMEITFQEEDDTIFTQLNLENVEVHVISWGNLGDLATIVMRLPVRAAPESRAAAGEFLHRLNFDSRRKLWEMDHDSGRIRLSVYTDTIAGPLTDCTFRSMLHCLVMTADTVFPYLTSVLSGRMTPEFADDQAEAALAAMWNKGNNITSDNPDEE